MPDNSAHQRGSASRSDPRWLCFVALALLLLGITIAAVFLIQRLGTNELFVRVEDGRFVLGDRPFSFVGANNYYLLYEPPEMTEDVFRAAAAANLTVMRFWGFLNGPPVNGVSIQPTLGSFDEGSLERLDRVIVLARRHGIRLVICLANNWEHFGGREWYAAAAGSKDPDDFYRLDACRSAYRAMLKKIVGRTNTINGIPYAADPTILGWELMNEPRCPSDPSGKTLTSWIAEMGAALKALAPYQLLAAGGEGFFNYPSPQAENSDWTRDGSQGADWDQIASLPCVDYTTCHLYPEHWGKPNDWGEAWIRDHLVKASALGKPMVLQEYGIRDRSSRNAIYQSWWGLLEASPASGSLVWILTGNRPDGTPYPDFDNFDIKPADSTMQLLKEHSRRMGQRSNSR